MSTKGTTGPDGDSMVEFGLRQVGAENVGYTKFPFFSINISSAPAYGVYISQLVLNARTCFRYQDFVGRAKLLTSELMPQANRLLHNTTK